MVGGNSPSEEVIYEAAVHKSLLVVGLIFLAEILDIGLGFNELYLCLFLGSSVRGKIVDDSLL